MASILDSKSLIKTIRRRAFIPRSQETFLDEDFLEMATEEINIGLMDQLIDARGDYLVYYTDQPFEQGKTQYNIPARAHGNKLRDVSIVDSNGVTIYELAQVTLDELIDFQGPYTFMVPNAFYIQNNKVILTSQAINPGYSVRMYFYMRPNQLVINERGGTIVQISTSQEIDNVNPKSGVITGISVGNPTTITSPNHGLVSGDKIILIAGTNSTPSVDGVQEITIIDENSFTVPVNVTSPGNSGSWNKAVDVTVYGFTTLPKHFTQEYKYDITEGISPNRIKCYDMQCNTINTLMKTVSFRTVDVSAEVSIGDYLTKEQETIVPNVPTEYHPIIAQRVAVACLEAMGDEQNKQSAERKLAQMEKAALRIITNRVEGAPKKIKQRHGTINQRINNTYYRRW